MATISTQTIRFYYTAPAYTTGLTDVKIDIYESGNVEKAVSAASMVEIGTIGIYYYDIDVTTTNEFLAVMSSVTANFTTAKVAWSHPFQHHYGAQQVVHQKDSRRDFSGILQVVITELQRLSLKIDKLSK